MPANELTISVSEFKAKCLGLFEKLAARKVKRVVVVKRGRPVAILTPPMSRQDEAGSIFGCMQGRVTAPKGFDFTAPVLDEPLNAAAGKLHG
jgi:antitoxin (DNA-binding transcriptional repressor) of toxin-antitoxin stability system